MILALHDEIARSEESRYDHRLHGVPLSAQGVSCYRIADWLGQHPTTVERWVRQFEARGLSGLREGERPGRPRRLDEATWQKLEQDLRAQPRDLGHPQNLWDRKLLSHHLRQTYGVELGVRQCQRLFRASASVPASRDRSLPMPIQKPNGLLKRAPPPGRQSPGGSVEPG